MGWLSEQVWEIFLHIDKWLIANAVITPGLLSYSIEVSIALLYKVIFLWNQWLYP
jgi:hypothetical protein